MNKDPIRTQNAKKVLIKDQVLQVRTLLETINLPLTFQDRKCQLQVPAKAGNGDHAAYQSESQSEAVHVGETLDFDQSIEENMKNITLSPTF